MRRISRLGGIALLLLSAGAAAQFRNNYPVESQGGYWSWKWSEFVNDLPPSPPPEGWNIPSMKADAAALAANTSEPTATWIGHASFLVQLAGRNLLFDPTFSERASPVSFAGPKRYPPLPIDVAQLPRIDVVFISHNHYDHLDLASVKRLATMPGGSPLFLVPLGLKAWFTEQGIARVEEMAWWQSRSLGPLRITFVPVQHWSKRTLWDANQSLWGAWAVEGDGLRLVHMGDMGYSKDPQDVGSRMGPFDWAFIPIGAYEPRWFMKPHHLDPTESVQVRADLKARRAIGMHWGTFSDLTDEPLDEPPKELAKARDAAGLSKDQFDVMKIGETRPLR